jgi:hypothetical protein
MKDSTTLFHYTTHSVALEHILQNGELRLSPISKVNDPRESLDWYYALSMEDETDLSIEEWQDIHNKLNTAFKENVKLLCMSQTIAHPSDIFVHEEFYKGYARSRMWAQYAGNHSGVCLAFDMHSLKKSLADHLDQSTVLYSGAVKYTNSYMYEQDSFHFNYDDYRKLGPSRVVQEKLARLQEFYFFTKNEDWASEQEFRILLMDNIEGYRNFAFQKSLKGIFLGHLFPKAYMLLMQIFSKKFEVEVFVMHWHNGYPSAHPYFFPSPTN